MYSHWNQPKYLVHVKTTIQGHGPSCASNHMEQLKSALSTTAAAHRQHEKGGKFATYTTALGSIDVVNQFAPVPSLTDAALQASVSDPGSHGVIKGALPAEKANGQFDQQFDFNVSEQLSLLALVPQLSNLPAPGTAPKRMIAHITMRIAPGSYNLVAASMEAVAQAHKEHRSGAHYATYRTVVGDINEIHHLSEIDSIKDLEMAFADPGSRKLTHEVHGQDKSCHSESVRSNIISETVSILKFETELSNI